jgi:hypothetical protein
MVSSTFVSRRLVAVAPGILLAVAVYFPSSWNGVISIPLWAIQFVVASLIMVLLVASAGFRLQISLCMTSLLMLTALIGSTVLSLYTELHAGALLGYSVLALLYVTPLQHLKAGSGMRTFFLMVNLVSVAAGIAVILGVEPIKYYLLQFYSAHYPDLLDVMMNSKKPVFTFATHSVAAFFYYLFFWLSLQTYRIRRERIFLLVAACDIVLMLYLNSVSAMFLSLLAAVQLAVAAVKLRSIVALSVSGLVVLALAFWVNVSDGPVALGSSAGGFRGRYTESGTLATDLTYIADHPMSPIGLTFSSELMVGDSGPVEYFLRGSLPLLLAIYLGLFAFLRTNVKGYNDAVFLFCVLLAFECGYTVLLHARMLCFLPFAVIYLNGLTNGSGSRAASYENKFLVHSVKTSVA